MKVSVIPGREMDGALVLRWGELQESDRALCSPFFRPEFTVSVAAVRADVHVGVLEQDGVIAGFFPFQRGRLPVGHPVGGGRSNYQGVVAASELAWDVPALLRGCRLKAYGFDHLIVTQPQFRGYQQVLDDSPYIDVSGGFDAYASSRGDSGSRVIRRIRQQQRRFEREVGALRFVAHDSAPEALAKMMEWKSGQYRDTGSQDRFAIDWNVALMRLIHGQDSASFQGWLPALYCEGRLVAVAMCMRSHGVVHYWFPTYDKEFATYSPGLMLLLAMVEDAQTREIHLIDLGRGHAPYKDRFANGAFAVAEGTAATTSGWANAVSLRKRGAGLLARARLVARQRLGQRGGASGR